MFIHGIEADRPIVLTLMRDELGYTLREAVQKKCPNLPPCFILLHQGRKVIKLRLLVACEAVDCLPNATRGDRASERANERDRGEQKFNMILGIRSFASKIVTHLKERLNNVVFFLPYVFLLANYRYLSGTLLKNKD